MKFDILNIEGKKVSEMEVKKDLFDGEVNADLFYEVVKMQMSNRRLGCASTKTRSEVSGSGRKLWKQKGSGRARIGSIRAPHWRHGGIVFGPKPRDYSYLVPKKMRKNGVISAIQLRINDGKLTVFDSLDIEGPKTKFILDALNKAKLDNALVVVDGENRNLKLAARNLKCFKLIDVAGINVYDILRYDNLVVTKGAFEKIKAIIQ